MRNNPLAIICIFFCLGIWAAKVVHTPLFFVFPSCILFLILALIFLKKELWFTLFFALAVFLSGALHLSNAQIFPAHHIRNVATDTSQEVYLRGEVVSFPESSQTFYHTRKTTFTFKADDIKIGDQWQKTKGLVKATLYGEKDVRYGQMLILQGSLARPSGRRNPGGFDYRAYLANHNIFGLLKVKERDVFLLLRGRSEATDEIISKDGILKAIFAFKQKLHNSIYQHIEPEQAALLSAILLGKRSELSQDIKDLFISTGTIHILAISGLHIGLITLILLAILRLSRFPRKLTFVITILLLSAYAFLSGARPSVVRATIMACVILSGLLINREVQIYNLLGLAALAILSFNPRSLFDSGFQLSFLSVISIVYFAPKIEGLFGRRKNRFFFYMIRAFSVSLAAWIGIAPLTAFYFNTVSPVAVLANLLIIPCLFVVVSAGITFLIFACLWAPLSAILAQTSWLTLVCLVKLAALLAKVPLGSFHYPQPGIFFFVAYYGMSLLVFNHRRLHISLAKAAIIFILLLNILVWGPLLKAPSDRLRVTFLDVGLGDAIFIDFPQKGSMLIDGGPAGEVDAGRWVILPFLWNKGINKIDALVLTHPDNDHVGGLATVLKNIQVDYVFDNGETKQSNSYRSYLQQVKERTQNYRTVRQGEEIVGFPETELLVLSPAQPYFAGTKAAANNNSVVLKLVYGEVSFIFCGDIQEPAIKRLVSQSSLLSAEVIKVPHHGSDEKEAQRYLFQAISPQLAVISVDKDNRFGFPGAGTLERLKRVGAKVYTTGCCGAVTISTDGRQIWVETMNEAECRRGDSNPQELTPTAP